MFELKPLSPDGVPRALEKAERYRLLNEPSEAESICLDILRVDPGNRRALVIQILAVTDQFEDFAAHVGRALALLPRLGDAYEIAYYTGIVHERRAKAQFRRGGPGSGFSAYEGLREAMKHYEKAEAIRPPGNDDAILRWNTCARLLNEQPHLVPAPRELGEPQLE
jgi:tetratricopeptide (TPR) repeat protein